MSSTLCSPRMVISRIRFVFQWPIDCVTIEGRRNLEFLCGCSNSRMIRSVADPNWGNTDAPASYSILQKVATGRDIILNVVDMPLKKGIACESYTVSSLIFGFDVVITLGKYEELQPDFKKRSNAHCSGLKFCINRSIDDVDDCFCSSIVRLTDCSIDALVMIYVYRAHISFN